MSRARRTIAWALAATIVAVGLIRTWGHRPEPRVVPIPSDGKLRPSHSVGRRHRALGLALAGLLLGVVALNVGLPLLTTDRAPRPSTPGLQALGPAAGAGRLGLVVRLGVTTNGCDGPAEASVVVTGTQEYWKKVKRKSGTRRRFAVLVGGPNVTVRDVGIGDPTVALADFGVFFAPFINKPIKSYIVRRNERTTVITGTAKGWGNYGDSLVIQLSAPWLTRRSYSSCWLTLPPLTGLAGQQDAKAGGFDPGGGGRRLKVALKPAERRALSDDQPLLATTYVQPFGGAVDTGVSSPAPISNGRTWSYSCRGRSRERLSSAETAERLRGSPNAKESVDRLLRGIDGHLTTDGFSEGTYLKRLFDDNDCAAMAVINDAGRGTRRDLFVLLLGAVLGLAGSLIIEGGLIAFRLRAD